MMKKELISRLTLEATMNGTDSVKKIEKELENYSVTLKGLKLPEAVKKVADKFIERLEQYGIEPTSDEMKALEAIINLNKNNAKIESVKELNNIMKLLKSKEAISQLQIVISSEKYEGIAGAYNGSITTIATSVGRAFREVSKEDRIIVPVEGGSKTITSHHYAPFTKDFVSIVVRDDSFLTNTEDDSVYVLFAGRKTDAYIYSEVGNVYRSVVTDDHYTKEELDALVKELNGELREFKCTIFSPSDVRNKNVTFKDITKEDDRTEYMNVISDGAYGIAMEEYKQMKREGASTEKLNSFMMKTFVRFGQLKAASINLGAITKWMYYTKPFELFCGEVVDGTGYIRASFFASLLTEYLGIEVTSSAVNLFLQLRPGLQKGAYVVLPDFEFNVLAAKLMHTGDAKIIGSEKDNEATKINLIADKNVVKLHSDYDLADINFELLEVGQTSMANSSKQMLLKMLIQDKETTVDLIKRKSKESLFSRFDESLISHKASIPTINEIEKGFMQNVLMKIAPDYALKDASIYQKLTKTYVEGSVNDIEKLRFRLDGCNNRLTSDISELYLGVGAENSTLKYGEIYNASANRHFYIIYSNKAKELGITDKQEKMDFIEKSILNTKIVMIKYPSMGAGEFYIANLVTLKEIYKRISNTKAHGAEKKAAFGFFKCVDEGLTILPARKIIMYKCAGLDYDYDGATFIFDQEVVSVFDKITESADCINS